MSLKAFHLVFVTASVLLMLGLTAWCFGNYRRSDSSMDLVWSAAAPAETVHAACCDGGADAGAARRATSSGRGARVALTASAAAAMREC